MAVMAVQYVVDAGTKPTYSAANASDTAVIGSGHNSFVHVKNGGASSTTVSITSYLTSDNGDLMPAHSVTVAAAGEAMIPLRRSYDKGDGTGAQISYTSTTSVTSALVVVQ